MLHDQMCLKIKMPLNFRKVTSHICCLLRNANSKEGWHLRIKIKFLCRKICRNSYWKWKQVLSEISHLNLIQ